MKAYSRSFSLLLFVLLSTFIFWLTPLDLIIMRWFYQPACSPNGWLLDCYPMYRLVFYQGVPYASAALLMGLLLGIALCLKSAQAKLRWSLWYVLLVFVLGSGLLVNSVFKENWGRARPVQLEVFGGNKAYTPPLHYVLDGEGHSFPSGHSSVGFTLLSLWILWRRSYPRRAQWALITAIVLGSAIGLARMAAGAHFLSDVIWSAWIMLFAAWWIYYPLLKMPSKQVMTAVSS